MKLSVIIINHQASALLLRCLDHTERALEQVPGPTEVLVIDNASTGEVPSLVRERHPAVRVVEEETNTGFSPAVVRGLAFTTGEWVALVNNDADVEPDALRLMLEAGSADGSIGSVAAQVRFRATPEVVNSAGISVDRLGVAWERLAGRPGYEGDGASRNVFGPTACVALYRRAALDAVGGFDSAFFAYYEDVDVAWRLRAAGWRSVYEARALALHRGSATSSEGSPFKYWLVGRNRIRLLAKNATRRQLARYGPAMVLYDLAYVLFAGATDKTLAPVRGRIAGYRAWKGARVVGAPTRARVPLAPATAGWIGALGQWRGYRRGRSDRGETTADLPIPLTHVTRASTPYELALKWVHDRVQSLGAPSVVIEVVARAPRRAYELLSPQGREIRATRRTLARRFLKGEGLEIGALHLPLRMPRSARVRYVDRMSVADLRNHYPELAAWDVVDVDIIDDGEKLTTISDGSVDFVVANHLIEHTEDPIATLENHLRVLRPGGVLFMAVPDKRHTFDADRSVTALRHIIDDYHEGPSASREDHYAEWVREVEQLPEKQILQRAQELEQRDFSIHFHVWTPDAFAELLVHCATQEGLPLEIEALQPARHEFITILRKRAG